MKKENKKILKAAAFMAACMGLNLSLHTQAKAADLQLPVATSLSETGPSLVDDVESLSDIAYPKARGSHLNMGMVEIAKKNSTRAYVSGSTQALHACPEVYLDIYVDKYNKSTGEWDQWRYWEFKAENVEYLTKSLEIIVPSGNYFSVRGYHSCIHDDVMETIETQTDGLYIGTTDTP
jgi:hypothetical protein